MSTSHELLFDSQALSWLDRFHLPLLLLDRHMVPLFLTPRGAKILGISDRAHLENHLSLLSPLTALAEKLGGQSQPFSALTPRERLEECDITTVDGQKLRIIARAFSLSEGLPSGQTPALAVHFQDVSSFEALIGTIKRVSRHRAFHILLSSIIGKRLELDDINLAERLLCAAATPPQSHGSEVTDLLPVLGTAVDIVDPLVSSSVKIQLDIKTSALIQVEIPQFLRIIAHLLVEGADFLGYAGKLKLSSQLRQTVIELLIVAQRGATLPEDVDLLELYLQRYFLSSQYSTSVAEPSSAAHPVSHLSLSTETFSDDLKIASTLARHCGIGLDVYRPDHRMLAFQLSIPLSNASLVTSAKD